MIVIPFPDNNLAPFLRLLLLLAKSSVLPTCPAHSSSSASFLWLQHTDRPLVMNAQRGQFNRQTSSTARRNARVPFRGLSIIGCKCDSIPQTLHNSSVATEHRILLVKRLTGHSLPRLFALLLETRSGAHTSAGEELGNNNIIQRLLTTYYNNYTHLDISLCIASETDRMSPSSSSRSSSSSHIVNIGQSY